MTVTKHRGPQWSWSHSDAHTFVPSPAHTGKIGNVPWNTLIVNIANARGLFVGVKSNLARLAADWQAARGRGGGLSLAATIIKPDANLSKDKSSLYFPLPRLLSSPGPPVRGGDWSQARPCHQRQLQDICSFLEQFLPRPRPPGSWWLPTQLKAVTDNNNNKHGATHQPSHVSLVTNKKAAAQL